MKNPYGYTIALLLTFAAFYIIGQSCTCILGLLVGLCSIIKSFIEDVQDELSQLNGNTQKLCNFIKLHSQAKQLSHDFEEKPNLRFYLVKFNLI